MKIKREAFVSEYIADALFALMKKNEYKDISITAICEKAGVTRMSFYRNFESKEDILKKWTRDVTDNFLTASGISYKNEPSNVYFIKLFTHMEKYKDICISMYKANLIYIVKNEFDRVFFENYKDIYEPYKSAFIAGGIYNVFLLWLVGGCIETPEELAGKLTKILEK